jgi:hypothetical protein
MDLTRVFYDIDEFTKEPLPEMPHLLLPMKETQRDRQGQLCLSEIMTILVMFHQSSGFRNFKGYYECWVLKVWRREFPQAVSYSRFVSLIPRAFWSLLHYLNTRQGAVTGISFIDSMILRVCQNPRISSHRVFKGMAARSKTSIGWFFGFKLHLIVNEQGDLLAIKLTPANTDDRTPVPEMAKALFGKLFGDKGYISQALFESLKQRGIKLITRLKKNMKPKLLPLFDRILLRKRALIESVNDYLKNVCHLEHSRHRSWVNAFVHLLAGLVAYTWQDHRPTLDLSSQDRQALEALLEEQLTLLLC